MENVEFWSHGNGDNGIKATWSNGETSKGILQAVDSVTCIKRYSLNEEPGSTIIIIGCEGTVMEMQVLSTRYGQVWCRIHLNGRVETMVLDQVTIDPLIDIDNPDFEVEFPDRGITMATQLPTDVLLEVVLYLSPSFKTKATALGYLDVTSLAKQIFSHASSAFLHESWGDTKIHLTATYEMLSVETNSINIWKLIVPKKQQKVGRLHCLLLGEAMIGTGLGIDGRNGTLGIAFPSAVCGNRNTFQYHKLQSH